MAVNNEINEIGKDGHTPLTRLIVQGGSIADFQLLLDAGDNLSLPDKPNAFPLLYALEKPNVEAAIFLMEKGANLNLLFEGGNAYLLCIIKSTKLSEAEKLKLLKALFKKGVNPYLSTKKGNSALLYAQHYFYSTIVKELKNYPKINENHRWAKKSHLVKSMGHILGLDGQINIAPEKEKPILVDTGGNFSMESCELIMEAIQQYQQKLSQNEKKKGDIENFQTILEAFAAEKQYLSAEDTQALSAYILFDRYKAEKLTILSHGWKQHEASVALYKNYLVYCNKGEGNPNNRFGGNTLTVKLSKEQQEKITPEWIAKLRSNPLGQNKQEQMVLAQQILNEVVDLTHLSPVDPNLITIPSKGQEHGNCSFTNRKGVTEGILYVLKLEQLELSDERLKKGAVKKPPNQGQKAQNFLRKGILFLLDMEYLEFPNEHLKEDQHLNLQKNQAQALWYVSNQLNISPLTCEIQKWRKEFKKCWPYLKITKKIDKYIWRYLKIILGGIF